MIMGFDAKLTAMVKMKEVSRLLDDYNQELLDIKSRYQFDFLEIYYQRVEELDRDIVGLELRVLGVDMSEENMYLVKQQIVVSLKNCMEDSSSVQARLLGTPDNPFSPEANEYWEKKFFLKKDEQKPPYTNEEMDMNNPCDREEMEIEDYIMMQRDEEDQKKEEEKKDEDEEAEVDTEAKKLAEDKPVVHKFNPDAEGMLQRMPGLTEVKTMLGDIIARGELNVKREKQGLPKLDSGMHMCFLGNPGTAKTTVARLLGSILYSKGIIKKPKVVECGRADLVGQYQGDTAIKVRKRFRDAEGGILFIDEAYSLAPGINFGDSYGHEAVDTIVQEMENRRDTVIVIFAGYQNKMERFMRSNEGIKSRINQRLIFKDYDEEDLVKIMINMAQEKQMKLSPGAKKEVMAICQQAVKEENFGNGRFVRNLFEKACCKLARRLQGRECAVQDLSMLKKCDFQGLMPATKEKAVVKEKRISFRLPG